MDILFNLVDEEFTTLEKQTIREALNLSEEEFESALKKIAKTAFMEYKKMFNEKGLPTRADEVLQERLYFLIVNYYDGKLPNESEVSSIFQLTNSQSKTLLKNVRSRYRTKIYNQIKNSLVAIIESAEADGEDKFRMIISSENLLEELNLLISQKGPTLKKITAIRGSAGEYACLADTYNLLRNELGLTDE